MRLLRPIRECRDPCLPPWPGAGEALSADGPWSPQGV